MEIKCFNGHPLGFGVVTCPICGACPQDEDGTTTNEAAETSKMQIQSQNLMDMAPSPEQAVLTLEQRNSILLKWLTGIKVSSVEEQKNAEDMLIGGRTAFKSADAERKEFLEPFKKETDRINGLFKPYLDKLTIGIDAINKALGKWKQEQDKIAEEARLKVLTEQAEAIAASKITGEIVELPTEPVPVITKTSHANMGDVQYREGFDIQIIDPSLVPRDLCDPNLVKIRARVNSGIRQIDGVLIIPKKIMVTRRM